ncbi:hypothetical protein [Streptococcus oricebi]|uniref:Tandem five-TM protein n=1 Tax=Streptococcus oricebi TaxID=1547447 RepID=A0ABS5B3P3_9STRE|nr:hypothetical protein [Streptococcus oricebi]MBP2623453.1 hypothetical protein [Streptococcus oricebi]
MDLKFIPSNLASYQIVEAEGKKYLMDTSTMSPKSYLWGSLPNEISVEMIELTPNTVDSFRLLGKAKSRTTLGTATIVLMVQPFVKIIDSLLTTFFNQNDISQRLFIKIALFLISILLTYLGFIFYARIIHKKSASQLTGQEKQYQMIFKTSNRRYYECYFLISMILICLIFYMLISGGREGFLLIINTIFTAITFMYTLGIFPVNVFYANKRILFERIEEINHKEKK